LEEAQVVFEGGADVVDLKEPSQGALGAVPDATLREVVAWVAGRRAVSATVGDLPPRPELVCPAVRRVAGTGVGIVKVGFFEGGDHAELLAGLAEQAQGGIAIVALFFVDQGLDFRVLPEVARAGLTGVMLDTSRKDGGSLRRWVSDATLQKFVAVAHGLGLLCGLAGSLRVKDVPRLLGATPDFLGFRGALCSRAQRTAAIDKDRVRAVREQIPVGETTIKISERLTRDYPIFETGGL
jgi:uncharacterized protein (UPF0264 family)